MVERGDMDKRGPLRGGRWEKRESKNRVVKSEEGRGKRKFFCKVFLLKKANKSQKLLKGIERNIFYSKFK